MSEIPLARTEQRERPKIDHLAPFDAEYFKRLEGPDGWVAIGRENCRNQRYFTVMDSTGEKLGIVGLYDTADDANISHTIVDPKYRGLGLAKDFKDKLLEATGETYYVAAVDLENTASLAAMLKIPGIKIVSDQEYETEFHKRKFRFDKPAFDKNDSDI